MVQDAAQIKERILYFLQKNGPSLPVHMSQEVGMSILFTSAFLSELLSERRVKTSVMRVGNSPLYFLPGQEPQLERFSHHLKSKEKEAYILLKEKRFLEDKELEPAIRVAIREIKDFAIPFQKGEEVFWRYFLIDESEFHKKHEEKKPEIKREEKAEGKNEEPISEISEEIAKEVKDALDIFDDSKEKKPEAKKEEKSKTPAKKSTPKKTTKKPAKKNESARNKFFNRVKEFLANNNTEIMDIEEIGTTKITFRVKNTGESEEYLIMAYNKKRVTELDIINAHKKANEMEIGYKILCLGEPLKKLDNLINATKTLKGIEKIE